MRKTTVLIMAMSLVALSLYADGAKLRNKMGIGVSLSATTTPTEFVFEQTPSSELITSGDFAATNGWTQGVGWVIDSGVATCTNDAAMTNVLTQGSLTLTSNEEYRITYTIDSIAGGTLTPSFGNAYLTARTSAGTYVEDVTFFGTKQLSFSFASTNVATNVIDDVSIYLKPDAAFVDQITASSTSGAATVYFNFNCTAAQFTNLYLRSKCLQLIGGEQLNIQSPIPIYNMYYRTASGSETAIINAL